MAKGYEHGLFDLRDLKKRFLKEVDRDVNNALSILRADVKEQLEGVAAVRSLEAIENEEHVVAGQLISAFEIQGDFGPEIGEILPALIDEKKTGIIKDILSGVSKSVISKCADQIIEKSKKYVEEGDVKNAIDIIEKSGGSYIADDFYDWLNNKVKQATIDVDYEFLLSVLNENTCWRRLDASVLVSASSTVNYELELKLVKLFYDDGYAFAILPEASGRVFIHASHVKGPFHTLEKGQYVYATVEPGDEGPQAVYASRQPQHPNSYLSM
jgi:cold shock CspA family protein